jgi:exonuclease SbcC
MDARNRRRHDELMIEYKSAESKHRLYSTLNSYIGDRDGDKFNRIVQRLTVQHLFGMANRRMRQLMDRYRIELADGTDDIWLTDLYMGGERRTIDSASGGERFIISLALALSLSEMASMNVKIDSMFIDEGFGSLSPDELYQAIDMLERLQVENEKMVGIISHVESLKERITTQIVARKLQEGESTLVLKVLDNERSLKIAG